MKRVFSNAHQCAHVWASQSQIEGKAGSVFFQGSTIYSYGHHFPVARIYKMDSGERVALFNPDKYSVTTSKHQSMIRGAWHGNGASHLVPTEFWPASGVLTSEDLQDALNRAQVEFDTQAMEAAERRREAASSKREAAKLAKLDFPVKLAMWQRGEVSSLPGASAWDAPIFLRVSGDNLETSKRATVPLAIAKRAWARLKAGKLNVGDAVGVFRVDALGDQAVKVGCHTIPLATLEEFFSSIQAPAIPRKGKCSCRKGVERDNCSSCEGSGVAIDWQKFHSMKGGN